MSHKYIDNALKEVGASPKTRAMFRAVYREVSDITQVVRDDILRVVPGTQRGSTPSIF